MNGKTMLVIAGLCSIVISGCTSLQSVRLDSQTKPPSGLTYRLPAKQFSVNAVFEITGCKPTKDGRVADLETKVSASFTELLIGAEAYTIDYQKLNGLTKVANTEFQLSETGLLTGVNVSIADQTGAVISNVVTAAASIARAVALPAIPAPVTQLFMDKVERMQTMESSRSIEKASNPCTPVTEALDAKKNAEAELEREKENDKSRAKTELQIREADAQIKALTDLAETYEQLGDEEDKRKLLKRVRQQEKKREEAKEELKKWGESQTEKRAKELAEAKGELVVVGSKDFVPSISSKSAVVVVTPDDLSKIGGGNLDRAKIHLPVVTMTLETIDNGKEQKVLDAEKTGIAYRTPVAAIAKVYCKGESTCNPQVLLLEKTTQIPQFGPIGSINLENIVFDDNLIELAFNGATGAPSKLTFRAKSKAEAASASVRDAAGTYLQLQKDKRDDRIAANKALLDQATAQVTLDKAKSDLALSKVQANAAAATTEAELQQALVSAQLQLLRDQQRLDAVRTGTATSSEVELEGLSTQEQLLIQRLKILKLEKEISEQKARNLSATAP